MRNHSLNDRPIMRWVEVRDADGRTRMEARWVVPSELNSAKPHAA